MNAFTEFTVHYLSMFWWFWSKWLYEWLMCVFGTFRCFIFGVVFEGEVGVEGQGVDGC